MIVLKAGRTVLDTIAIGISAQRISVALLDTDIAGLSRSDLRKVMMETIIVANTATPVATHSQAMISTPFTGRTPPSG